MAQARGVQTGAYAEALLDEFDGAIAEVQEVIDDEKGRGGDKRIFFQAVEAKKELLTAKAKALGLGGSVGRPVKGNDLPVVDDLTKADLTAVAKTFIAAQEQPPAKPEASDASGGAGEPNTSGSLGEEPSDRPGGPGDGSDPELDEERWAQSEELARRLLAEAGESVEAEGEVAVVDGSEPSNPS